MQQRATSGIKILLSEIEGASVVQGAWRFFNNHKNVHIKDLFQPIFEHIKEEIPKQCDKYILAPSDWSHLDYKHHSSKKDLRKEKRKNTCMKIGYDLQSTIAVSDRTGTPLGVVAHNLKTSDKVYSTYDENISIELTHLDELALRAKYINETFQTYKPIVHIVDREADSIAFMRSMDEDGSLFLVRAKENSKVSYHDAITNTTIELTQKELASKLPNGKKVRTIKYKKEKVDIFANECMVTITRDATKFVLVDEKKKLIKTTGKPLRVRFVVERLVNSKQEVVAEWLLLTNVFDEEIDASTIATWYYYRWNIESYFKLLKSSGFNLEEWQQRDPEALFKRLLVVSYTCMLVWRIANDSSENAKKLRDMLIKISGMSMEYGVEFTYPALLKGLESYFATVDLLERFSVEEIFKMRNEIREIMGI
ncbi:MAG: transposase [Epsilonproteobacteria bacterium]|nr:transposase [Campylobacterota bacterium]